MFPATIETDRLRLERTSRETLPVREHYEHCKEGAPAIDEITRHVTWDPHGSMGETREFLVATEEAWEDRERASYVIRPREGEDGAGEFAGNGGVGIDWDRRTATLGTWLRKQFWGRGYSGERARALIALAFDRLDLEVVSVSHHPDNDQSRRAIEKYVEALGGRREGRLRNYHTDSDGTPFDAVRYSITAEEWRGATGGEYAATFEDA